LAVRRLSIFEVAILAAFVSLVISICLPAWA
jgi:hypothetical protein